MADHLPNPHSPEEVRRAFGRVKDTYVPYTGAIDDVDLGANNLTMTGNISATDISAVTVAVTGGITDTDFVQFDTAYSAGAVEGRLRWNSDDGTLECGMPGGQVNLQIGQEHLIRCRNETGTLIGNGKVVYVSGQSGNKPLIALSKADDKSTAIVFGVATEDIAHNDNGFVTLLGLVRDINTTGFSEGGFMFLSASTAGGMETTPAAAPGYKARVGWCLTVHSENGVMLVSPIIAPNLTSLSDVATGTPAEGEHLRWDSGTGTFVLGPTHDDFYNGTFRETFDALLTSNGTVVTLSLEQSGTGDLTMQFSDGETTLDCTDPVQTIALTVGDDDAPQANYIYVLQSTKALTKDTSSWPATEHIKVGYFLVPSATFVDDHGGAYVNQNWNDHLQGTDAQGHLSHIAKKIRRMGATWFSGVSADGGTVSYFTIGAGSTQWISTAGVISQMHEQTFPVVDMTGSDLAIVVNDNASAYTHVTDLFSITDDNTGTTITNNRYFNLVFWGVANKSGELSSLMVNLPGGFYTLQSDAEVDSNGHDVYDIPREFNIESGTAFLIARVTFQMGSTWDHISTVDLRGLTPATASGSSVNDHGGLGGLADDDHTQYVLYSGAHTPVDLGAQTFTTTGEVNLGETKLQADGRLLHFGAADDAYIQYDDTNLLIKPDVVGSGIVIIQGGARVSGYLGVGISNPGHPIHIFTGTSGVGLRIENTNNHALCELIGTSTSQFTFGDAADSNIGRVIYRHTTDSMGFDTNNTEAIRIDSSQRVGLKTSSPDERLHVNGNAKIGGDLYATGDVYFTGAGSGLPYGEIYLYNSATTITIASTGVGNKVQVTAFAADGESNLTTPAHGTDDITITKPGRYMVNVSAVIGNTDAAAYSIAFGVFKNDGAVQFQNLHSTYGFTTGVADERRSVSLSGIISLSASDTVELWCWNDSGGTEDVDIVSATLSLSMVGG